MIADVRLIRYCLDKNHTLGIVVAGGKRLADTLELPWLDNADNISCIPKGVYKYKVGRQNKAPHADCIWILNVPQRDAIQMHSGNYLSQIEGCILPGEIRTDGVTMVLNSKPALKKILTTIPKEGTLEIIEV